ncbi:pyrophosphatase PpaX [Bacillus sp. 2205SS5-2]|uniref:pyrophosphatase PpaX n=1 Tax=Bacillus sp. 2205SS5-2 TaxID=3109031 RepID=UPI0030062915
MKNINTILFDLDGTLIDTNELIISSFLHTLNYYFPNDYQREDVLTFIGPPLEESFEKVAPDQVEEMVKRYRAYNLEHHDKLVKEFSGVKETVVALHELGYKLAIVSTKIRSVVIKGLELMNLRPYFDVIIALDDVTNAKPDPEPLYKALEALGSLPEEACMIGDNHHDILAGKNANTTSIGVAWSAKGRGYLEDYHPDYILEEMPDLLDLLGVK